MPDLHLQHLPALLATYGYWAVLLIVAVESIGAPVPGETTLLVAAVYAGTTHHLHIALVIAAAAAGAILGDNLGYLLGRLGGRRLLHRYGRFVRLDARRLATGEQLFIRHGGKVVFFGRFVGLLRMWAAFLAGANRMSWHRFLAANAAGGAIWAVVMGSLAYWLGTSVFRLGGPIGIASAVVTTLVMAGAGVLLRRAEQRLGRSTPSGQPCPVPVRADQSGRWH